MCAIYRRDSLLKALDKLGDLHGQSMHALCDVLIIDEVHVKPSALIDIDTPADLIVAHELN